MTQETKTAPKPCFNKNNVFIDRDGKELTLSEKDRAVLLELYKENTAQGRHHETQRSTITTISFAFAGVVIGLLAKQGSVTRSDLPLTIFLALLGLFAATVSYKQYERSRNHMKRAEKFRNALDSNSLRIADLKKETDKEHKKEYSVFSLIRLHVLWSVLFILIAALGSTLAYIAWSRTE